MSITVNTGNEKLDNKVKEWLQWDKNETTIGEVKKLLESNDEEKLSKLFLGRMEFGTAGLRGRMGAGYTQMNDLVIIQTAQGLVQYLLKEFPDCQEKGFVIGYDGRHNSRRFAELTATVFLNRDVKVYLYSDLCPTPFVPFAVTEFGCVAGVMVTASHNPKEDNGYKVYWRNGAQIISPHDKEIQRHILSSLEPLQTSWNTSVIMGNPKVKDPLSHVMISYYEKLGAIVLYPEINGSSPLRIVYTAMHGVGYKYLVQAFKTGNFREFYVVEEQKDPDPEFPTVKFPNPEEGKSALNLSIKTAEENGCTLILANDPDADRLAVAEKNARNGQWKIFNGNEIGALLGWWSFQCYKFENPGVTDYSDVYMLASTVSSKILKTMATMEGFQFEDTLTGFKWMGNVADKLLGDGKKVLFAFEEAIGFMCKTAVLDKDGVSAAVKVAEMAAWLLANGGLALADQLEEVYALYGQHITLNSYFVCHEPKVIKRIFHRLRNFAEESNQACPEVLTLPDETLMVLDTLIARLPLIPDGAMAGHGQTLSTKRQSYPKSILNGKYEITEVRDLTTGYDTAYSDKKARLPTSKSSQMITFRFANGLVATLRTSGTEPKVKYYTELCADPSIKNIDVLRVTLKEMVDGIIDDLLQPIENGLIPRSD